MNTARSNFENQLAYEDRRAYFQGIPRGKNFYETLNNNDDQAAAWGKGWDQAQEEDAGLSYTISPPNEHK